MLKFEKDNFIYELTGLVKPKDHREYVSHVVIKDSVMYATDKHSLSAYECDEPDGFYTVKKRTKKEVWLARVSVESGHPDYDVMFKIDTSRQKFFERGFLKDDSHAIITFEVMVSSWVAFDPDKLAIFSRLGLDSGDVWLPDPLHGAPGPLVADYGKFKHCVMGTDYPKRKSDK